MFVHLLILFISSVLVQAEITSYIVNGIPSDTSYKYHAHLNLITEEGVVHVGSGVVISRRAVLTTALNIYQFVEWKAGFGSSFRSELVWKSTNNGYFHPEYNWFTQENNLGFLFFEYDDLLSIPNVQSIGIPSRDRIVYPLPNEQGLLAGFGITSQNDEINYANVLQLAFHRTLDKNDCSKVYPNLNQTYNFCAQDNVGLSSICGGDQGGAFVTHLNGKQVLTGIVSFIRDFDCDYKTPAVFLRTTAFRDWIVFIVQMTD